MTLQSLFDAASSAANRGQYADAADLYIQFLKQVQDPHYGASQEIVSQSVRSAAFNLAQVLNKSSRYAEALHQVQVGLRHSPSAVGIAIAMAAKGEALVQLGNATEGRSAFSEAVAAHPIIGALNAADSMTRLDDTDWLLTAEAYLSQVREKYWGALDDELKAEFRTVQGKIEVRRGELEEGRRRLQDVVAEHSDRAADARHELQLMDHEREEGLVERAFKLSCDYSRLAEAIELMEQAIEIDPSLRAEHEETINLWRRGVTM